MVFDFKSDIPTQLDKFTTLLEKNGIEKEYENLKYHFQLLFEGERQNSLKKWIQFFVDVLRSLVNLKEYIESHTSYLQTKSDLEAFIIVYLLRIQSKLNNYIEMLNDLIGKTTDNARLIKINAIFSEINLIFFNLTQQYENKL